MTYKSQQKIVARFEDGSEQTPDRYILLTHNGELQLIRNDNPEFGQHTPEVCFQDSYIFETLEDIYWQPKASNLCAHLHPPTSSDMAHFMVQRYIIPVMRDMEIIQCGLERAVKQHPNSKPRVSKATRVLFDRLFHELEVAKANINKSVEPQKAVANIMLNPYDSAVAS